MITNLASDNRSAVDVIRARIRSDATSYLAKVEWILVRWREGEHMVSRSVRSRPMTATEASGARKSAGA